MAGYRLVYFGLALICLEQVLGGMWMCPPCRNHQRLQPQKPCAEVPTESTCEMTYDGCDCCLMCAKEVGQECSYFEPCVRDARCVRTRPLEGSVVLSTWDFYGICQERPEVMSNRVREGNSDSVNSQYPYPIPEEHLP